MESLEGYISNLDTYLFWRDKLNNFETLKKKTGKRFPTQSEFLQATTGSSHGVCPICEGGLIWELENGTKVRCLCLLLNYIQTIIQRLRGLRTYTRKVTLEEFKFWGSAKEQQSLRDAYNKVQAFYENPRRWLILYGMFGCGKTHLMQALARAFGPFALYISSSDFESTIFRAMDERNLGDVMWAIERAPILLFDDWGSEHGSKITQSKFRQIIDFRYNMYPNYPVMITTNELPGEIYANYDPRTASRVFDKNISTIALIKAGDYRLEGS